MNSKVQHNVGDFVVVMYKCKKTSFHFVGEIKGIDVDDGILYEVTFLTKLPSKNSLWKFKFPDKKDWDYVSAEDIVTVLTTPSHDSSGCTKHTSQLLVFDTDLSMYFP